MQCLLQYDCFIFLFLCWVHLQLIKDISVALYRYRTFVTQRTNMCLERGQLMYSYAHIYSHFKYNCWDTVGLWGLWRFVGNCFCDGQVQLWGFFGLGVGLWCWCKVYGGLDLVNEAVLWGFVTGWWTWIVRLWGDVERLKGFVTGVMEQDCGDKWGGVE